jgi:hypothetical protein
MKTRSSNHVISLHVLLGLAIVLTEAVFLNFFGSAEIELALSSAVVTVALLIQLRFGIRRDAGTPADMVVFIFDWLFLDFAPKAQLLSMPQTLVNTSSVSVDTLAVTNLVCALFIVTFTVVYRYLMSHSGTNGAKEAAALATPKPFTAEAIGVAVFVCLVVVALAGPSAYKVSDAAITSPSTLIVNRFLLFLPSATLLILLNETVRSGRKWAFSRVCVIVLLVALVLITENPRTEKRNALGPIYIGILLVAFQSWFSSSTRRLLLLVLSMVVVFPASSILTHHNRTQSFSDISMSQFWDQIAEHYFSINYDSWANVYTSVEIVKVHGLQWGHQLIGALLFFVPSAVWTTKPYATGIFLANYLIANYSMWFTNLSAPLVGEGYLDFGYAGVVVYAGVLAMFVTLLNKFALRRDSWAAFPMAIYASVFLMIILRGSLMIALGFASGAFLSFCFASALLSLRPRPLPRRAERREIDADTPSVSGSGP